MKSARGRVMRWSDAALRRFALRAQKLIRLRGAVSILITDDSSMRALNRRYRKKNKPTDVLSFPSELAGCAGDIAISVEFAARNAHSLGHSLEKELMVLVLHGLLHLAGYDHEKDEGKMAKRESELRKQLRLPQTLTER